MHRTDYITIILTEKKKNFFEFMQNLKINTNSIKFIEVNNNFTFYSIDLSGFESSEFSRTWQKLNDTQLNFL